MSKKNNKKLLEENTIRRFMGLARLEPLANTFISRLNETFIQEKIPEEEEEVEGDMEIEKEPSMEEPPPEEGMEAGPEGKEDIVASLVDAIADAIEQATGVEVEVEKGGEGEGEGEGEEMPVEEPPSEEFPSEEGEEQPLEEEIKDANKPEKGAKDQLGGTPGKDMKMKEGESGKGPGSHEMKDAPSITDSLVNEVVKRVLAKILEESKKKKSPKPKK